MHVNVISPGCTCTKGNSPDSLPCDVSRSSGSSRALPRQSGHWASGPSRAHCQWESPGEAARRWAPPRSRSGCSRRRRRATMTGTARQACCATSSCRVSTAPSHMHAATHCLSVLRCCGPAVDERALQHDISVSDSCLRRSLARHFAARNFLRLMLCFQGKLAKQGMTTSANGSPASPPMTLLPRFQPAMRR